MSKDMRPPKQHKRKAHANPKKVWVVDLIDDAQDADEVSWTAPDDSKITIWFPPERDPLNVGTRTLNPGETLSKTVPPNAKGTYPYSVYLHKDNVMAEGGSSPEIIIVG
jgi:hypothetical protein